MSAALRDWEFGQVVWGSTTCEAPGCFAAAAVLANVQDGRGVPLCIDDADVWLERTVARTLGDRGLRDSLPDPWELRRAPGRGWRPSQSALEFADRTPEAWLAEQGYFGERIDTSDPDWDIPF